MFVSNRATCSIQCYMGKLGLENRSRKGWGCIIESHFGDTNLHKSAKHDLWEEWNSLDLVKSLANYKARLRAWNDTILCLQITHEKKHLCLKWFMASAHCTPDRQKLDRNFPWKTTALRIVSNFKSEIVQNQSDIFRQNFRMSEAFT